MELLEEVPKPEVLHNGVPLICTYGDYRLTFKLRRQVLERVAKKYNLSVGRIRQIVRETKELISAGYIDVEKRKFTAPRPTQVADDTQWNIRAQMEAQGYNPATEMIQYRQFLQDQIDQVEFRTKWSPGEDPSCHIKQPYIPEFEEKGENLFQLLCDLRSKAASIDKELMKYTYPTLSAQAIKHDIPRGPMLVIEDPHAKELCFDD